MEIKLDAYRLVFPGGVHIGTREGALEGTDVMIHSDTLYSAFFNGYRLLYGKTELEALLRRFHDPGCPFLFSSAFPFWKDRFYLPVPKNQLPGEKEAQKIALVDAGAWSRLLRGESLEDLLAEGSMNALPGRPDPRNPGEPAVPWKKIDLPRVSLDRMSNHPGQHYFHCGELRFSEDAGLYFLVQYNDPDAKKRVEAVWRLLADEGLGGDRTVGKGLFHYPRAETVVLDAPDDAAGWMALSLYYPGDGEWTRLQEGYYDLIERRGYIFSKGGRSLRRKTAAMFTEGSVFPAVARRAGAMVDVTPRLYKDVHRVFRAGIALGAPCVIQGGEA
ncbi:MAG: type III-A CRISPR-associated RAMP protein Csm4 [Desulfobacterales bacterium]|nr:type III-A CRISPR-associated RAMP protein Csm4 [Desulfobacterales bacterium]